MLDATDGKSTCALVAARREHSRRKEGHTIDTGTCDGAMPHIAVRTRGAERTGSISTEARSRIKSSHSFNYKVSDNLIGHML
jgi:hypothetical protein